MSPSDPTREAAARWRHAQDCNAIGYDLDCSCGLTEFRAALSTTPAPPHSCDCDEHERTVGGLQSRLAEMEGAFNECRTRLATISAAIRASRALEESTP